MNGPEDERPLECHGIRVSFAGVHALDGVDVELKPAAIMGLIGTNGAGKTTLVNCLSGYQRPTGGRVMLRGQDVTRWSASRLAQAGIARTFQAGRVFPSLTVLENIEASGAAMGLRRKDARARARELLRRVDMVSRSDLPASALPHGEIRIAGILRALATQPQFMLVDEPAAGSNESESQRLLDLLKSIADEHRIGLLVIEHDMTLIMRLCHRIQVLDHGKTIALGTPTEVRSNPEVIRAYLGTENGASDAAEH